MSYEVMAASDFVRHLEELGRVHGKEEVVVQSGLRIGDSGITIMRVETPDELTTVRVNFRA